MYTPLRVLYLLLFVLSGPMISCASSQDIDSGRESDVRSILSNLEPAIDAIVAEEMEATHLPGVAVVVVHEGKTIINRGYGLANIDAEQPVDVDRTLFRIGSVSKALTGLALSRLIDDGRVDYQDDVSAYFEQISNPKGIDQPVTVEHLLTHTGGFDQVGLNRHIYDWERPLAERKKQRPSLAQFLGDNNLRLITRPGHVFRYDTYGISLAGLVLARATNLSYSQAMQQEMFGPLGMKRSFVEADEANIENLALGYGWVNSQYEAQPYEVYVTTPASSIDATPSDMARLLEALTGGGANSTGRLFSEKQASAVLSPQFRPHPRFTGITHSLWESPSVDPPDGPAVHSVGHGGSMLGFWTLMEIFTEKKVGVFISTNRNWEAGGGPVHLGTRINKAILEALYEEQPKADVAEAVPGNGRDLSDYEGNYVRGIYCQSCSMQEFAQGAWPRGNAMAVTATTSGLRIDDESYYPTKEADVFVRDDGKKEVFFGRDEMNAVSFYVTSFGPTAFEKLGD